MKDSICIAEILTAHGVRGLVKLRCHLEDPQDLASYNPLHDERGKAYDITLKNPLKNDWIAEIKGMTDRNEAEKLRGVQLFVPREALPDTDDGEFYYEDLIGCAAVLEDMSPAGEIIGVEDFGAGDLIEIRPPSGKSYYLPIAEPYVGEIDLEAKRVVIAPVPEFMNE